MKIRHRRLREKAGGQNACAPSQALGKELDRPSICNCASLMLQLCIPRALLMRKHRSIDPEPGHICQHLDIEKMGRATTSYDDVADLKYGFGALCSIGYFGAA